MGGPRPTKTRALLGLAVGAGAACVVAAIGTACSSPGPNPPNLQDCTLPGCTQPLGVPLTSPLAQNTIQPGAEDAGVVDAEVVPAEGSGIPAAGPGPGITGLDTTSGINATNELGPVCPATAPTNGAPCAPAVNTIACIYSIETCFCTTDWICF